MATNQYLTGRKKYQRPQALLFSENPGRNEYGFFLPEGYEIGTDSELISDDTLADQFIVLSDDNRQPIDFKIIRLEKRERMINGRMRSHHIADKRSFSVSWDMLPSRAFSAFPNFDASGKSSPSSLEKSYTTDGGAGGVEILDWYQNHKGSFWVFLAYDKMNTFGRDDEAYGNLPKYNEVIEMYITDFSYSVQKRGGTNHDFWSISMTLEEA
jgi:hypothetical protein